MSKQPTRAGAVDFSLDLLTMVVLNRLKNAGTIDDFKGRGKEARIKKPNMSRYTPVKNDVNTTN